MGLAPAQVIPLSLVRPSRPQFSFPIKARAKVHMTALQQAPQQVNSADPTSNALHAK
jgi:hypothetical protein